MDRVSGWYKRSTQWIVFIVAVVVTLAGNVDSIAIAKHFYRDEAARSAAVASAQATVAGSNAPGPEKARELLDQLELPIGWSSTNMRLSQPIDWVNRVLGWLLTVFAATLGAPFWFDVLNKVMVIRSTVKPREKSQDEASEDRQRPPSPIIQGTASPPGTDIAAAAAAAAAAVIASQRLAASDEIDCCGGAQAETTEDEQLPAASGGVELS